MKRYILLFLTIIVCGNTYAQSRDVLYKRFSEIIHQKDTAAIVNLISEWERLYPNDAELYSVRANYAYKSAFHETVVLSDELPQDVDRYLEIKDPKDSTKIEGYMFSRIETDSLKISQTASILSEGIAEYPDRIDLRMGKVRILLDSGHIQEAMDEISSALRYSKVNGNKWLTTLDAPVKTDGVSYLQECVQDFLFEIMDADALSEAENMIDTAVSCYPRDAVFLSDKATLLYFSGDLQKALKTYQKASKFAPEDMLILNNIAQIHSELGHVNEALKCYRTIAESSDEEYAPIAEQAIKELSADRTK